MAHATFDYNSYTNKFENKIFYGRTNILKFKLCHKYCETCIEFGIFHNNQTCITCLEDYTYDYFYSY